jgi:hypothetical protein
MGIMVMVIVIQGVIIRTIEGKDMVKEIIVFSLIFPQMTNFIMVDLKMEHMAHIEEDTAMIVADTKILTIAITITIMITTTTTLDMTSLADEMIHTDKDIHKMVTVSEQIGMVGSGHTAQALIATKSEITTQKNRIDIEEIATEHL